MNNLDNKVQEIIRAIDERKSEISVLEDNNSSLTQECDERHEKIRKLNELIFMLFHYKKVRTGLGTRLCINERKVNLKNRKQVFQFLYYICSIVFNLSRAVGLSCIMCVLAFLFVNNIYDDLVLIAAVNTLISVLSSYYSEIFNIRSEIYSKKATQNLELFGDYIYNAKRISETLRINEDKVKNISTQIQQNNLQVENMNKEIMELEKIIEEINCYKSIYDEVINNIYEDNMPIELKEKISNPFVKVKRK